jgi:hypothetical protein
VTHRVAGIAAAAFFVALEAAAQAQPSAPRQPAPERPTSPPNRPLPDDARGWEKRPSPYEPEDVGLFVPRAILFLPRLALRLLFYPVQKGLEFTERHRIIEHVEDILYNDARTAGVVPTLSYGSDYGLGYGFTAFHDDLSGFEDSVAFDARFGGRYVQAYQLAFAGERVLGTRYWTESLVRFEVSPHLLFEGYGDPREAATGANLGPRDAAVETRFRQTRLLYLGRFGYTIGHPGSETKLGGTGILNHRHFGDSTADFLAPDERGLSDVYDPGRVPGFEDGVRTVEVTGNLVVDTRDEQGATSSGIYLEGFGGALVPFGAYRYAHWGAELTGYVDLYRKTRVLVLRGAHEGVAGSYDEIPFSDLPRLGGSHRLRGYPLDRFRDRQTAVATAEYHYPIHQYVAGALFVDAGRAATDFSSLFDFDVWRVGWGGGFIVRSKRTLLFSLQVAYGDGLNVYFTTDPLRAFAGRGEQL